MYFRIARNSNTRDGSAVGYLQRLRNSLHLVGVVEACAYKLGSELKRVVQSGRPMPRWIDVLVELVMKPLTYCKGQNWSSCSLDKKIISSAPKAKGENDALFLVEEKQYFQVNFSPNVLSLFLETRVDLQRRKVYMMSPRVNNRHLHLDRVWNGKAAGNDNDPGIIATMLDLGVSKKDADKSLSESYYIFPYTVYERSKKDEPVPESELAFSEHVFSCQKGLNDTTRVVRHPDMDVYSRLLGILVHGVRKDRFYCVNKLMLYLIMFCLFLSFMICFRMRKLLVQRRMITFLSCHPK